MFQMLNPKNSPTTTLQSEMLELLLTFQSLLLHSQESNQQLALTEVTDCIYEIALADKNPMGLSLEVAWMVRQIETLHYQEFYVFTLQEERIWTKIKDFILTYPFNLREASLNKNVPHSLKNHSILH